MIRRNMHVTSWNVHEGWGKAVDKATGTKIYLSIGRSVLTQRTGFLRKVHRTKEEAVEYAQRFFLRYQRLAVVKASMEIWKRAPWHVKLRAKIAAFLHGVTHGKG